MFYSL